jgi:biopolymer transport protein ExbD/biopolymer transport protein TolR
MRKLKNPKAAPVVSDINVTPLVDVMLVMLIIFMVITPMLSKGVSVDMAKTKNPIAMQAADKEDAVLVAVTRDGRIFLSPGNTQMKPEDLPNKVKDLLTNKLDKTVYIKSDRRAKYSVVTDVVDNLRAAGVDQLGLLTEQAKPKGGEEEKKSGD